MTDLLVGSSGLPVVSREQQFIMLDKYCSEHLHGELKEISTRKFGQVQLSQRRCVVDAKGSMQAVEGVSKNE